MKHTPLNYALVLFTVCNCLAAQAQMKGAIGKPYAELERYNYFAALQGFYKQMKKEPAAAAFGLSVIYGRSDNPFTDLDSAHRHIIISRKAYPTADARRRANYKLGGLDSIAIVRHERKVDSLIYRRTYAQADTALWEAYLKSHFTPVFIELARAARDSVAYSLAIQAQTAQAFAYFMERYPDAMQIADARRSYDLLTYRERTASGRISDYQRFLADYPDSPYRGDAEYEVYRKYTRAASPEAYMLFIEENPNSQFIDNAWRNIYAMETGDLSPRAIAAFSLKYPDYPYMDELKQEFNMATTAFFPVKKEGLWGFIDENGVVRIKLQYDFCEAFSEGKALVGKGDKVTFVSKDGSELNTEGFDEAFSFRKGYAPVEINGKIGIINRLGKWILQPEFDECGEYSEGFFYAKKGDRFGYMNARGRMAIPFEYDNAGDFRNGLAVVQKNDFYGAIDTIGNVIIDFAYNWIEPFQADVHTTRVRAGSKFGLIHRNGTPISEPVYDALGEYAGGFYLAAANQKYGFLNRRGDTAIAFTYEYTPAALQHSRFENGFARVYQKDKTALKIGVIDTLGKKVMPAMFDDVGPYKGRFIPVKKKNQWGYAGLDMKLAIPYRYDAAESFGDSLALVMVNGKWGLIDTIGQFVLQPRYQYLEGIDSLYIAADSAFGLISAAGRTIVPMQYAKAENIAPGVVLFTDANEGYNYYHIARQHFIWREEPAGD